MFRKVHWFNGPNVALFLKDPLLELTRRERTSLLAVATVGLFIAHTGLVPTQITVLGIVFEPHQRVAWYVIASLVVAYYLSAFSLYCVIDYIAWSGSARTDVEGTARKQLTSTERPPLGENAAVLRKAGNQHKMPYGIESQVWSVRCAFDMVLPVVLGLYSVVALLFVALAGP
jgi:hypothetical protein